MSFPFAMVSDANGMRTFRPVLPVRLENAPRGECQACLVDTGSPDTYLDWQLASAAGIDLARAAAIPYPDRWAVGGVQATALWGSLVTFLIEDDRYTIRLTGVRALFTQPWAHPGFTVVLGTEGMKRVKLTVDAGEANGRVTISQ